MGSVGRMLCESITMALSVANNVNTFVPSFEATGQIIGYTRDPAEFRINDYIQIVPAKEKSEGFYLYLDPNAAARVNTSQEWIWPDGAEAPIGNENQFPFEFRPYKTERYSFPFVLGTKAVNQASWDIIAQYAQAVSMQAMLLRTVLVANVLQATGNWGTNTDTAVNLGSGAGKWATSTLTAGDANYLNIKKTINKAVIEISKATNGRVRAKDLRLIVGPDVANAMANTAEINDYVKQSPFALAQVRGDAPNQNGEYGLPTQLYSLELVVEDATKVTSKKNAASTSRSFLWTGAGAAIVARPGALVGVAGAPSFSTVQLFAHEEMTTETKTDTDNRRTQGRVVDDFDIRLAAPASGYYIQTVL